MTTVIEVDRRRLLTPVSLCAVLLALLSPPVDAAPVLRSADIRIVIRSADACDVRMILAVDGATAIDHRIEAVEGSQIDLTDIHGARQVQPPRPIGRTLSLILEAGAADYELAYSVQRSGGQGRCPLWVPAAPADGVSRAVRVAVDLPSGMSSRGTMPALAWHGPRGTTTLGHIPAFVRVPYVASGESALWDVSTAMDALTIVVFAGASAIWIWRRKR
jgi:hypothetical protein